MIKKHFGPNVEIGVQWIKRGDDTCGAIFVWPALVISYGVCENRPVRQVVSELGFGPWGIELLIGWRV